MVEAARLEDNGNMIAVSLRAGSPEEVLPLICRACALSPRERELVTLVLQGLDTRQIAHRMFISAYTVKDHLKSVFGKLGIRNRRELLAGIFGHTA
jgi:DNA-binding CsgD family transcriptional regulator